MGASVKAVDGEIVLNLKKFLVEEGGNEIGVSGPQNFIYVFSYTVGDEYVSKRGKAVIELSTGEVWALSATSNYILLDSDEKIQMQYVVSDTDPDVGDGTQVTTAVTLT